MSVKNYLSLRRKIQLVWLKLCVVFCRSAASLKNMVKTRENKKKHVFSCFCSVWLRRAKGSILFFNMHLCAKTTTIQVEKFQHTYH
jgi:hypothetical protein